MRQIAAAAGNVIQFDRRNGINGVALDLYTPASNTQFPSASLSFQLCPCTLSKFNPLFSFPRCIVTLILHFLFYFPPLPLLSICPLPPLPRSSCWFIAGLAFPSPLPSPAQSKSPITRALLLPLLTNTGVRPGTTQVCHKQVGGTGREREGTQDDTGNS